MLWTHCTDDDERSEKGKSNIFAQKHDVASEVRRRNWARNVVDVASDFGDGSRQSLNVLVMSG